MKIAIGTTSELKVRALKTALGKLGRTIVSSNRGGTHKDNE